MRALLALQSQTWAVPGLGVTQPQFKPQESSCGALVRYSASLCLQFLICQVGYNRPLLGEYSVMYPL